MKYARILGNHCGFEEDDICKIIKKKDSGYEVFVPGRVSNSACKPNVWISRADLVEYTEEEYNKAHNINIKGIKPEDFVQGEYYAVFNDNKLEWIRKHDKYENEEQWSFASIGTARNVFYRGTFLQPKGWVYQKATPNQIKWLDACVDANKFIHENEIKFKPKTLAKKGEYVVLLHGCTDKSGWNDISSNYVYQLREDCTNLSFRVKKDEVGRLDNGWYTNQFDIDSNDKLVIRLATQPEIEYYKEIDKPFDIRSEAFTKRHDDPKGAPLFYIKYDSKVFTKELFDILVEKLINKGYPLVSHMNPKDKISETKLNYDSFVRYGFLRTETFKSSDMELTIDNNSQHISTEMHLSDFIGITSSTPLMTEEGIPELNYPINNAIGPNSISIGSNSIAISSLDVGWGGTVTNNKSTELVTEPDKINTHLKPSVLKSKNKRRKLKTVKQFKF